MISVEYGSNVEPLNSIQAFNIEKEVNGNFTVSLTSFNYDNAGYELLQEESIINVDGYDFRVKQLKENKFSKNVTALSTFFDLNDERRDDTFAGTKTFNEFASYLFNGTGWTFTSDITESKFVPNFGNNNIIALVNALCSAFECEYEILQNNVVHFAKQIGGDNDAQYRYKHNVKALSKAVDTTKLKTQITGYGANGLSITYTSPIADDPQIGIRIAEPVTDERFAEVESLRDYLKSQLVDYPEVSFEMDVFELTDKQLGESVWLIYEPMNIEFKTRILKQTIEYKNNKLVITKVVLGNVTSKSTSDILVEQKATIDQNAKVTRSRFEQTNDRITLEVETINDSIGTLEVKADEIALNVTNVEGNVANLQIQANQIESTVSSQAEDIGNMKSSITQMNNEIDLKVDANGIISSINMSPETIAIQADKINLTGAVVVNGSITGTTNISVTRDADIGNNLYLGETYDQSYSKGIYFGGTGGSAFIRTGNNGALNLMSNEELIFEAYGDIILDSHNRGVRILRTNNSGISDYVAHTNRSGFGLFWNGVNRIYFKENGVDVAYIDVTPV